MKLATRLSLMMCLSLGLLAVCAALLLMVSTEQDRALRRELETQAALTRIQAMLPLAADGGDWPEVRVRLIAELAQLDLPDATRGALNDSLEDLRAVTQDATRRLRRLRSLEDVLREAKSAAHGDFTRATYSLGQMVLLFCLLLVLALSANAYVLRRAVLLPVAELQRGIEQLTEGRFELRIELRQHDEFGALAAAYNKMAERLHASSIALVRDNFERARAVEDEHRSEERWRQLAAASFEGILVLIDGMVVDANEQAKRLFGYPAGGLTGVAVDELMLPVEGEQDTRPEPDERQVFRYQARCRGGELRQLEVRMPGDVMFDGQPARMLVLRDVTDEELLRRRLVDALAFAREVIGASPLGIMVFAPDRKCLSANAAAAVIVGGRDQQQLERDGLNAFPPALRRRLQAMGRRALRDEGECRRELHYARAAGNEQYLDVRVLPFSRGGCTHLLVLIEDSTERRRVAQALNESEARFRALVENIPAVTYLTTLDEPGEILYISPQIERLVGCPAGEFRANPQAWRDWMHPEDRDNAVRRHIVHNGTRQMAAEYRMVNRDGGTVWVRDEATMICGENGEPLFLQGLLHDVTGWKTLERKLQRAYSVLEETADLVLMLDSAGQVFYCNRAARDFCGVLGACESSDSGLAAFFDPATVAELRQKVLPVAEYDGSWSGEMMFCQPDGRTLPVLLVVQAHGFDDKTTAYYSLTARDVTMLKRLEQARAKTEATLAVINAQADGLLVVASDGLVTAVNPAFAMLTGLPPQEVTGQKLETVMKRTVPPEDQADALAFATRLANGTTPEPLAMRIANGRVVPVLASAAFIRADDGKPAAAVITLKDISSIRAAEEQRRESAMLAQAIIDANRTDAVFLLDGDGRFLAGNQTLADRFRRPLSEIIGRGQETLLPPEVAAPRLNCVREVMATGEPIQLEDSRDGMKYDNSYYPVHAADGRTTAVAVVSRDVTARRQAEDELLRLASGLAEAQRIAHMGSWEWDIVTGEETWSDENFRIFGLQPGEIRPDFQSFLSFVYPEDRARVEQASRDAVDRGLPYDIVHRIVRRDGELRIVREQGEVEFDAQRRPLRKTGTMLDITEAEQARQNMRISEERYRSLFESSADGIFFTDMDGIVLDANRAFMFMAGYDHGDIRALRLDWHDLLPERWRGQYEQVRREQLLVHGLTRECEQEFIRSDGTIVPVAVRMWLLHAGDGTPVGTWGIARDITERKAAERRVKHAIAEIERSNRELEQFAYVASHDLQEPLTVIAGYVGLLAHRYKDKLDDKAARYIDFTTESVMRMQAMIQGLLQYSRVGHGDREMECISLNAVFSEVLQNLATAVERTGARVTCDALPRLCARRYEMVRLLQNLIENALKYRVPGRAPEVRVSAARLPEAWEIAVTDNGPGIPPQHRERIFQIFQRLHTGAEFQGTGIGLAICKKMVEKYGGTIHAEDNPGGGAIFRFTLALRVVGEG